MAVAAIDKAMGASESGADLNAGGLRGRRSSNRLHRAAPEFACSQTRLIEIGIGLGGANDAEPSVAVPQGERDGGRHPGITGPALGFLLLDVPGRDVCVVNGG